MESNNPLVVIDVQPGHDSAIGKSMLERLIPEIRTRLKHDADVHLVYNDYEMSGDTLEDVKAYFKRQGLSDKELDQCKFQEKQYAELRGWMDMGVPSDEIVAVVRAIREHRVFDSRQLDPNLLASLSEEGADSGNPIFLSAYLEGTALSRLKKLDICGGGRDECLREVELWMESLGIEYERLDHLVY